MSKRRENNVFSIAFLDLLSGALGAVIILYIAVPKAKEAKEIEQKSQQIVTQTQDKSPIEKEKIYTPDLDQAIKKIIELEDDLEQSVSLVKKFSKESQELEVKVSQLEEKLARAIQSQQKVDPTKNITSSSIDVDVGFKFKGKQIVFIIDVSGSMHQEDRIGQVKAGLKMLITSMGSEFSIDVIHFPDGFNNYKTLWGGLRPINKKNKQSIYQFLHKLRPFGATPTRAVMKYALKNYSYASDIVLLSDGAPTDSRSKKREDIGSVLRDIQNSNQTGIQINTVGVGGDFLNNTRNDKYIFLKRLSENHSGFFVGF